MKLLEMPVSEAIILAGGLGTRLRAEVPDLPKPMAPVNGRPFLEYLLDYLHAQGLTRVILSVGYKHEVIIKHFGDEYRGIKLVYAIESEPLGTGGALLLAWQQLQNSSPVVVMNGDTWFPVDLAEMAFFHRQHDSSFSIAVRREVNDGRYAGIEFDSTNRIINFSVLADAENQWINAGIYLVSALLVSDWQAMKKRALSLERDLISGSVYSGNIYAFLSETSFIDIGVPGDYYRAAEVMKL